jgi:hypothetical protein
MCFVYDGWNIRARQGKYGLKFDGIYYPSLSALIPRSYIATTYLVFRPLLYTPLEFLPSLLLLLVDDAMLLML